MNRIYKVIWSKVKNCYIVVSELAKKKRGGKNLKSQTNVRKVDLSLAKKILASILMISFLGLNGCVQAYNAGTNSKDYNDTSDNIDTVAIAIGSNSQAGMTPTDNPKVNAEGKYVGKDGTVLVNQTKKPFISVSGYVCSKDAKFYTMTSSNDYISGSYRYRKDTYTSEDGLNKVIYDSKDSSYTFYPNNESSYKISSRDFYSVSNRDIEGNYYSTNDDFKDRVSLSQGATAIGNYNKALGDFSSVLGGNNNQAIGKGATVVGGSTTNFIGKVWVTNTEGKYVDSNGQVLINQTNAKLTDIRAERWVYPGVGNTYYDKNTKQIYKCGMTSDTYCYTFTDENGVTYTGNERGKLNCTFKDENGNMLTVSNLLSLSYIDCNGNYFDENGNPYTKDDFSNRVVSDTEGATVIVNNLAKGDFSTIIGGTGNLAQGEYSIVAGKNAVGIGVKSVAIGGNAQAVLDNSIALGEGAVAKTVHLVNNSSYAGISSSANEITVLSVGNGSGENGKTVYRQIQGVAAGEISATSTDAINGSQLFTEISKVTASLSDNVVKYDDDTKGQITLSGAEGTIIANVKAGEVSAASKEAVNGSQLYAEQESRKTADITLQSNIEAEKTARENAITSLSNDLSTKVSSLTAKDTELEGKIGDVNTSLTTEVGRLDTKDAELEGKVGALNTAFTIKVGELSAKDTEIEGKITTETSTRESEVSRLDTRIDNINTSIGNIGNAVFYDDSTKGIITLSGVEGTIIANVKVGEVSAASKEAVNGSQLYAEQESRKTADITLQGNIEAEKTARENAITALNNDITTKVSGLTAKDAELEGKIGDVNASLTTEVAKLNTNDSELEGKIGDVNTSLTTEVGRLDTKDAELEGKVGDLNTTFTTKTGELSARDTEIEGKITTEINTRESEVSRLDTRIDNINTSIGNIGNAVFYDDNTKGQITLSGTEGTIIANVKAGEVSATSKEAVNGSQLYAEQESRKTADITLQGNIEAEKTARENAITSLSNDLTTKVSSLTAKDTELEGKVGALNKTFTTKVGELSAKDTEIEGKITTETNTRESEVSRLDTRIDNINTSIGNIGNAVFYDDNTKGQITLSGTEGTIIANVKVGEVSAASKEAVNGSQLYAEQESRKTADITLQGNIDAEKTARENAITSLNNEFTTKVSSLTAKDTELEGKIGDVNASLTTEVGRLDTKDAELEGKVGALNTVFTTKVGELSAKDTEIEGKITTETSTRESEVSRLDTRIDNINTSIGNIGNAVFYDDSTKGIITLSGVEGTIIANVKAGEVSAASKEAVNGSQLYTEQEARISDVAQLNSQLNEEKQLREAKNEEISNALNKEISNRTSDVNNLRLEFNETLAGAIGNMVAYTDASKQKVSFGGAQGTMLTNLKNGSVTLGSTDAVTGDQLYQEKQQRENDVKAINSKLNNIISTGNVDSIVYDNKDKASVTFKGDNGTTLKNVAAGTIAKDSKEAVNGSQLYDEAQARIDGDNALRKEFGDYVASITDNSVGYDAGTDKTSVTFKGDNGTTLKNVAAGTIAKDSKEAVNGSQLYETTQKVDSLTTKVGNVKDGSFVKENDTIGKNINYLDEAISSNTTAIDELGSRVSSGFNILDQKVNNVGAHAAALAALNPVADDDSKLSFAVGMGSYHNAKAGAIGMFYRPDDRYQFNIGGTTGNGEHMYNIGFSVGLDKNVGGPFSNKKAMIREIVSLKKSNQEQAQIINEQNTKIDSLQKYAEEQNKRLAAQDAKIAQLTELVEQLAVSKK